MFAFSEHAARSLRQRLRPWAVPLLFTCAALVVRLHWNLVVHPPEDFVYSDMRGYMSRALLMLDQPWKPREYNAFYPFGTHVLLWGVMAVFGREDLTPIAVVYALIGAAMVGFGYALARQVSRHPWVPPLVGAVLVCDYALISLGGYYLSEIPFAACLTAGTFFLLRMIDHGRRRDAWATGIWVALGMTFRPQILLSAAFIGLFWLALRRRMPRARLSLWLHALAPIVLVLGGSAVRLHYHTGRWGLLSENGTFNQVFGRCHNEKIVALPDKPGRVRTAFGPPPLLQLSKRAEQVPGVFPQLDPALDTVFEYRGYIGDASIHRAYIRKCVAKTGLAKQVEYSFVNTLLLWRHNVMWPDAGKKAWQPYARRWGLFWVNFVALGALASLLSVFFPRHTLRLGLLALHHWALVAVAVAVLGGVRFRAPYDPILLICALEMYALAPGWGWNALRKLRGVDRQSVKPREDLGGPRSSGGSSGGGS